MTWKVRKRSGVWTRPFYLMDEQGCCFRGMSGRKIARYASKESAQVRAGELNARVDALPRKGQPSSRDVQEQLEDRDYGKCF